MADQDNGDRDRAEQEQRDLGATTAKSLGSTGGQPDIGGLGHQGAGLQESQNNPDTRATQMAGQPDYGDAPASGQGASSGQGQDLGENLDASKGVGRAGTGDGGIGEGRSFAHDAGGGVGVGQSDEERLTELTQEKLRQGSDGTSKGSV